MGETETIHLKDITDNSSYRFPHEIGDLVYSTDTGYKGVVVGVILTRKKNVGPFTMIYEIKDQSGKVFQENSLYVVKQ